MKLRDQKQGRFSALRETLIICTGALPAALYLSQNHYIFADLPISSHLFLVFGTLGLITALVWLSRFDANRAINFRLGLVSVILIFGYFSGQYCYNSVALRHTLPIGYAALYGGFGFTSLGLTIALAHWAIGEKIIDAAGVGLIVCIIGLNLYQFPPYRGEQQISRSAPSSGANVYYFILDGHPGTGQGFALPEKDNAQFVATMSRLDFVPMGHIRSNYAQTRQALGSIMNLKQFEPSDLGNAKTLLHYPSVTRQESPPPLFAAFNSIGYHVYTTRSAVFGCQYRHSTCLSPRDSLEPINLFFDILQNTPLSAWKRLFQNEGSVDAPKLVLDRQAELLARRKPFFLFVHHLSPHPPYHYNNDCKRGVRASEIDESWRTEDRTAFVRETLCLNQEMENVAIQIIAKDSSAIIVLQSDHGPWFGMEELRHTPIARWSANVLRERLSFLNQVRLPTRCAGLGRPGLGQMNTARLVLACLQGRVPVYGPERSAVTSYYTDQTLILPSQ
jgi:hypothetical protein